MYNVLVLVRDALRGESGGVGFEWGGGLNLAPTHGSDPKATRAGGEWKVGKGCQPAYISIAAITTHIHTHS